MTGPICVYGLWHLGCVTAACLAEQGAMVVGLDADRERIAELQQGRAPIAEPGLNELLASGVASGRLAFSHDAAEVLPRAHTLWVTFDTPVDDQDRADLDWLRLQFEAIRTYVAPHTLVLVASQVPVGFTAELQRTWQRADPTLRFAVTPENLRLGRALEAFRQPERIIVGVGADVERARVAAVFGPLAERIEWMSLESAEMTKHALNAFLATSVAFTNEVARICERVGADAAEVERGLRSEVRIGRRAYVTAGGPIAGGTLARDVEFLNILGAEHQLPTPLLSGVRESNRLHMTWIQDRLGELLRGVATPRVTLLGLTYKPGTDTLRRSAALDLAHWLNAQGIQVQAFDPAIRQLPTDAPRMTLSPDVTQALQGADAAVLGTPWPAFADLSADQLVQVMRRPQFVDQAGFLPHLASDARLHYVRVGRPLRETLTAVPR